jgi:hypothetical protein
MVRLAYVEFMLRFIGWVFIQPLPVLLCSRAQNIVIR